MLAVVAPLVMRSQCSAVAAELCSTTDVGPLRRPYAIAIRQGPADGVPFAVKKDTSETARWMRQTQ